MISDGPGPGEETRLGIPDALFKTRRKMCAIYLPSIRDGRGDSPRRPRREIADHCFLLFIFDHGVVVRTRQSWPPSVSEKYLISAERKPCGNDMVKRHLLKKSEILYR